MTNKYYQKPDANEASDAGTPRGKLKIFFGSCAGVGKTHGMLLAAQEHLKAGMNIAAGIVETHGRPETEALLQGIKWVAPLKIPYRGVELMELNVDAVKASKPAIILVDEIAHSNAPGSHHDKRWKDVEQLLDAGIDVYTTLNVQHMDSLRTAIAQATGVWVNESVPDRIFDGAKDIVFVDTSVKELLKRLDEGKVFVAAGAMGMARNNFFKEQNLERLREITLRYVQERVDNRQLVFQGEDAEDSFSSRMTQAAQRVTAWMGLSRKVKAPSF